MSHFSVAVITKGKPSMSDIEEILYPFDESLEIEQVPENEDGDEYFYNPDARWDWYCVGGRWAGKIRTRNPEMNDLSQTYEPWYKEEEPYKSDEEGIYKVDCCRIKDIIRFSQKCYDNAIRFWELFVEGKQPENEEDEALIKDEFWKPEYYIKRYKDKEEFAKQSSSFSTYAVVKDGEWLEAGKMGWWGISDADEEDEFEWDKGYSKLVFEDAGDDDYLTIVDCHI